MVDRLNHILQDMFSFELNIFECLYVYVLNTVNIQSFTDKAGNSVVLYIYKNTVMNCTFIPGDIL